MKTISLKEAIELLKSAAAVIIPSLDLIIKPDVYPEGRDAEYFLQEESRWGETTICWDYQNQKPRFDGSNLYFIDEDGDELKVTLLEVMKNENN